MEGPIKEELSSEESEVEEPDPIGEIVPIQDETPFKDYVYHGNLSIIEEEPELLEEILIAEEPDLIEELSIFVPPIVAILTKRKRKDDEGLRYNPKRPNFLRYDRMGSPTSD